MLVRRSLMNINRLVDGMAAIARAPVFRRGITSMNKMAKMDPIADSHLIIGRVHSIETFTAIDGPGIRYMVFLQGCGLRCKSCSNRDTWEMVGGKEMSCTDVIQHMLRYRDFIEGVTVSGGEALLQPYFVASLFQQARQHGLTTCLDTAGQAPKHHWDVVLPHTDVALVCIKHVDPVKYKHFTGMNQASALEFVDQLAHRYKVPFHFRYLYIPGFTDDLNDIDRFLQYAEQFKPLLRGIELLPYHRLGVEKWKARGETYELENVPIPSRESVEAVKKRMEVRGFKVLL